MSASFTTGLECKHCKKHSPQTTVWKQWGEEGYEKPEDVPNLALKVDGDILCCKCGVLEGLDDDEIMPVQVGRVIRTLLQDCLFEVFSITDARSGSPFVWLNSRVTTGVKCQVRWFRDHKWVEGVPARSTKMTPLEYDPSQMKARPPVIADHTIRQLIASGVPVTEIPKGDVHLRGYTHLGFIIEHYDNLIEEPREEEQIDLDNPRQKESIKCPVIVHVGLQWDLPAESLEQPAKAVAQS